MKEEGKKKAKTAVGGGIAVCAIFNSPEQWLPCISGRPTVAGLQVLWPQM